MKRIIALVLLSALMLTGCSKKPTWEEQYNLGIRYLYEGNYEEAVLAFNVAIEIDPKRGEAYMALADAYAGSGQPQLAIDTLTGGMEQAEEPDELREKLADVQFEMGSDYLDQGLYEEAEKSFLDAIESDPKREDAYLGLADAYMGMGEIGKVVEALQEGANAVPNASSELMDRLGEMKELKAALDTLTEMMSEGDVSDLLKNENISSLIDILSEYRDLSFDGRLLLENYTGKGLKLLPEDWLYYGDLVDGVPNGTGAGIKDDGSETYSGEWKNGKPNGTGTYTFSTSDNILGDCIVVDVGNWIDGKGNGTISRVQTYSAGYYAVLVHEVENGETISLQVVEDTTPYVPNKQWIANWCIIFDFT